MKKLIYGIFAVMLLCAFAAAPASAQVTSTWDQIMKTKKLRLGAAPTEPWYYKDTTNGTAPGGVVSGGVMWRGVGVTLAKGTDSDQFAIAAARLEPVTEVLHLSGEPDHQLRVACVDTAELDALLRTLRNRLGAIDTETTVVLRSGPPAT